MHPHELQVHYGDDGVLAIEGIRRIIHKSRALDKKFITKCFALSEAVDRQHMTADFVEGKQQLLVTAPKIVVPMEPHQLFSEEPLETIYETWEELMEEDAFSW